MSQVDYSPASSRSSKRARPRHLRRNALRVIVTEPITSTAQVNIVVYNRLHDITIMPPRHQAVRAEEVAFPFVNNSLGHVIPAGL